MIQFYQVVNNKSENMISSSPWVIATELFLKHKNLEFEAIPLTYTEVNPTIDRVTNGKWSKVPTLIFPSTDIVFDSRKIAEYLDEHYHSTTRIIIWNPELDKLIEEFDKLTSTALIQLASIPLHNSLDAENQAWFKNGLEAMFGISFEKANTNNLVNIQNLLKGLRYVDEYMTPTTEFLDGKTPGIHDYYLMGRIQSFRTICPGFIDELLIDHKHMKVAKWVNMMCELYGDYLYNRKTLTK